MAGRTRSKRQGKRWDPIARIQVTEVVDEKRPHPDLLHVLEHPNDFHLFSAEQMQASQWKIFLLHDKLRRLRLRLGRIRRIRRLRSEATSPPSPRMCPETTKSLVPPSPIVELKHEVMDRLPEPQSESTVVEQPPAIVKQHRQLPTWEGIYPCCGQPAILGDTNSGCTTLRRTL